MTTLVLDEQLAVSFMQVVAASSNQMFMCFPNQANAMWFYLKLVHNCFHVFPELIQTLM
jgi:hypothetical protein